MHGWVQIYGHCRGGGRDDKYSYFVISQNASVVWGLSLTQLLAYVLGLSASISNTAEASDFDVKPTKLFEDSSFGGLGERDGGRRAGCEVPILRDGTPRDPEGPEEEGSVRKRSFSGLYGATL